VAVKKKTTKQSTDDMTRLNVEIESAIYAQIKARCALERKSISEATRELWISHLKTNL